MLKGSTKSGLGGDNAIPEATRGGKYMTIEWKLKRSCMLQVWRAAAAALFTIGLTFGQAAAQDRPNILVIWGDDIGWSNFSVYHRGMMGYATPNVDKLASEGAYFTDFYAEQSCTAGRASFITGQLPFRTGLTKVGLPGAKLGISSEDPTFAQLLKNHGYSSGQFGKNHLGDRNEYLPTVHGFDEYSGLLYHLNAMEEPENVDWPDNDEFNNAFRPRNVIHSVATDEDNDTEDPRWGRVGKQMIEDRGPLTIERMKTFDDESLKDSISFMERAHADGSPWFIWHNTSRIHSFTHLRPKYQNMVAEKGFVGAAMTEFDDTVGALVAKVEELGVSDNTIIIVTTDNGAMKLSWPDGGTSPFRNEKATTWDGGFRVPAVIKWPGTVEPGRIINDTMHQMDWIPTIMSALGEPDLKEKLKSGYEAGGKTYKVHLDGYDHLALLKGEGPGERKEIHYITDDGNYSALRYGKWKVMFNQQNATGFDVWGKEYENWRAPRLTDLHADPFEQASMKGATWGYEEWAFRRTYLLLPAGAIVKRLIDSFEEFPPRQKPATFSIGDALSQIEAVGQH